MSKHAEKFIKERYKELEKSIDENYINITIRLPPEDALMLKAMSKSLNFSISSSFTDILSQHLYDMIMSLKDEEFKKFMDEHCHAYETYPSWLNQMFESGIVNKSEIYKDMLSTLKNKDND
ncbi:hypothetical protein GCM10011502_30080 [Oceanisphaera marina]|uniref:CopG family transcriptional regulator n=1 Tax=Oceanisphaera marina TaxID=2017550 RepID=A0ABQ1IZI5_9GAMM|nr:hypothetical protein [Oceanisphaera marina]GGB55105.1 hypothetical protein GCM10011502_30080 [Oceanisphaera marina]